MSDARTGKRLAGLPPLGSYRFTFIAREPIRLPAYDGSAWRGLLGHGLRRTVCVTGQRQCTGCPVTASCTYSHLFETPPEAVHAEPGTSGIPAPYVLVPNLSARELGCGEKLMLGVTLLGSAANRALPFLARGMHRAGTRGIGSGRGRFQLAGIEQKRQPGSAEWLVIGRDANEPVRPQRPGWPDIPPAPRRVRLELETPLRFKSGNRFVGPEDVGFDVLARALLRRFDALRRYHGDGKPLGGSGSGGGRVLRSELRWWDWQRYSSRQRTSMFMGGLLGAVELELDDERLWPLLWLGQWTHLGKACSMGLGRYRIVA